MEPHLLGRYNELEDANYMKNNGHFLSLFEEHHFFRSIIENEDFSKVDLNDMVYTNVLGFIYNFKNIEVGDHTFKNVEVSSSPQITLVTMLTDEITFFDEPVFYFDQEGAVFEIEPYMVNSVPVPELRRQMRTFQMLGRTTRLSIYKSTVYGCKLKFSFPNESKIKEMMDNLGF